METDASSTCGIFYSIGVIVTCGGGSLLLFFLMNKVLNWFSSRRRMKKIWESFDRYRPGKDEERLERLERMIEAFMEDR